MALSYSKISYEHREILLKERPKILYDLSKKGTVPVLQLIDGTIVDESIDVDTGKENVGCFNKIGKKLTSCFRRGKQDGGRIKRKRKS